MFFNILIRNLCDKPEILNFLSTLYYFNTKPDMLRVYGGGKSENAVKHWVWKIPERYFNIKVIFESDDFDPNKLYLCGAHPHGVYPFGLSASTLVESASMICCF